MYRIGINFGGISITAGIITLEGEIVVKESIPTLKYREIEVIIKDIAMLCKKLVNEAGLDLERDIESIGIGTLGMPDNKSGKISYSSYLNFHNTPIREIMKEYINVPVSLENNARCCALAESKFGAAKGYRNSITLNIGYTIGAGIIINNKIYYGAFCGAGEVGHQVIVYEGEQCNCGRHGCWEAYASASAIVRDARIMAIRHPESEMFKMVNGDLRVMSYKIPFEAAERKDPWAIEIVEQYLRYLSVGIINIINVLQPDAIVIGGRMSEHGEKLLEPLRKLIAQNIYGDHTQLKTKICSASLGNDAFIIGAAMINEKCYH